MKVLIAEDELLERKAMRKFLEDHFPDVTIAGEAVNGRTAVELALETTPDIILMDIKMPGMDGMEAITHIREKLPYVKFIMVTAYDSFDYAKQAMQLGVKEYILKPGKKEETIEAIRRSAGDLERERQSRAREQHNAERAKQLFLSYIMNETAGIEELQEELYPRMRSGFFLVIEDEQDLDISITVRELKQWTADDVIVNQEQGRQIIVLAVSEIERDTAETGRLIKRIHLECGKQWLIGSGKPVHSAVHLSRSYYEALLDLQKKKGGRRLADMNSQQILEDIREAVQEPDVQKALTSTLLFLEHPDKHTLTEELYYTIKQLFDSRRIAWPEKKLADMADDQDWYEMIQKSCVRLQQHYHSLNNIERAKQWIDNHLQDPITLEDAAEYAGLSPAYFSNVFKTTTGENVTDYVTKRRLQKAVALLKEQTYSLKEISFMVGYKDPNYFSRVFKKYYELSPKQYQKKILKY
ncbi:response regulator transcription factor [Salibacterium aidingense]|uniref:response regulator transcription factor n=1 Tax=Salibacterium aidingense TaxID=384933 RepID=UPI003BE02FD4